ncbi:TylF/MycF/NovP-related O-methyltransferase [Dongia sp.]|uniref:TylF/MycF/NovP-related O-methyltransferase n=1 Tax=Dongia sp. TaxID=1977262 RepID=UPI0037517B29
MTAFKSMAKKPIQAALGAVGLQLSKKQAAQPSAELSDQPDWIRGIIRKVTPFTMTSHERLASLCQAVAYVVKNRIEGDIIECGVWKGGSMMAAALALKHLGDTQRSLFLFDTFEGMSEPSEADVQASDKQTATAMQDQNADGWCYSPIDEVRSNIQSVGYPSDKIHLIKGKVEDTIPYAFPKPFAILRLDTDWYESTRHELQHLYPQLVSRGALIIDDYGHWEGARRAVDEYIEANKLPLLLNRIDYTGRIAIKP